ncbi:MAG TPA: thioredoxin family protein [Anaerolineales bacterium]|nr:thioredoxin family protein [Anaerolineales bacterium]
MLERLLLTLLLAGLGWLVYRAISSHILSRHAGRALSLDGYRPGRPAILFFTAPGCGPCDTVQRPALTELRALSHGRLQVIEIDATQQPRLADAWGVLTVPTTFVIDSRGRPRGVNHGVARAKKLAGQLSTVGELNPAGLDPSHAQES